MWNRPTTAEKPQHQPQAAVPVLYEFAAGQAPAMARQLQVNVAGLLGDVDVRAPDRGRIEQHLRRRALACIRIAAFARQRFAQRHGRLFRHAWRTEGAWPAA